MPNRRQAHLDALERLLTGPKRVGLFGHRNVGKTTLLAMFYREASAGRVPGLRLAAVDATSAEYLAEKIARIESGEPPAGTLAETALALRLYHGLARFDLIVKDYQGEHVTLGSDEPIQAFFADCDAVLLCLDPDGSAHPAERRRRQQEVEHLLERYFERSDAATADRPVALLVTKYDRVLARDGPAPEQVERLVEAQYGMTRHALAVHVPRSAVFAVSSYGRAAENGRPPAELRPMGLEGPLAWLAEQLEAADTDRLEWLWDLAPADLPRLSRCVKAYERRYPRSEQAAGFRRRLDALRRRRGRRRLVGALVAAGLIVAGLAGYDAWGYYSARAFERDDPAPAAARDRWNALLAWHPSLPVFWPEHYKHARRQRDRWTVTAAEAQVRHGTATPDLPETLTQLKDQAPHLVEAIQQVEAAQHQLRHEARWKEIQGRVAAVADPEDTLGALQDLLRDDPKTPFRDEAESLRQTLLAQIEERQVQAQRLMVEELARAEGGGADPRDLIDRAQQFLAEHPDSPFRAEVEARLDGYLEALDRRDIERAREYSRQYPTNFPTRIARYEDYLRAHPTGGRYISEAMEAKDHILQEWDTYTYRQAYDHYVAHPDDVAEVARMLNAYLQAHPDGRYADEAHAYLDWWERIASPGEYRITLRRGQVEKSVGKYLSGGAPDLSVEIEVAGVTYGPSPVIKNSRRPIWDYTFPRPVRWKLGDPVTIRIIDNDWSPSPVYTLRSGKGDPLAIRLLSGTIKPSRGGQTQLVFASDFAIPRLPKPGL